jgi:PKD repeat protein
MRRYLIHNFIFCHRYCKSQSINIRFYNFAFVGALIILFGNIALADEHWAVSLKPADIQAAVNVASPGDTVVLPAGDYSGFNTSVDVYARISIRGQGKNATILRKTSTTGGFASGMFRVAFYHDNPKNQMVNSDVQFHDFSIYGMGGYDQTTEDTGFGFNDIQYGTTNIQFYNLGIYRFGNAGIVTSGWPFTGVIYNCDFGDCYLSGLGYGVSASFSKGGNESVEGITAYQAPVNWGGPDWLFIEDCTFTNCRHCINGSVGGRFVARYNDMTPKTVTNYSDAAICAHGTAHTNDTATVYGTSAMDIYNNTFHINLSTGAGMQWIWQVGGAIRAHDNVILGVSGTSVETQIWDPSDPITYPHPFMTTGLYYWDNTFDGVQRDPHLYNDYNEVGPGKVWQPNRDYFFYMPSGYTTYPYPHPLRGGGTPHLALSPSSLQFSATTAGSKPSNQTFQVSNSGGGSLNWSVSDNASWLTCSPTSGTNGAAITVSVDQTGLSAGSYSANISVSSTNADNSPQNLSVSLTVTASAPPLLAAVSGSPTSGQAPLAVSFAGGATGGTPPYSYRWAFGDSGSSTTQNPSHTYSTAGNYSATLTVTDSQNATNSQSLAISVTAAPSPLVATASGNPTSGIVPLAVNFTGSATGGTSPYTYRWTFGDGSSSTTRNPSHTYSTAGSYTATLTVTDSQSATNSKSLSISVTAATSQLTAAASANPTSGVAPLAVNFTGGATGGTTPYSYSWSFGDGGSSSTQNPSHTYSASGSYTATLSVTDAQNASNSKSLTISVTAAPSQLTAAVSADPTSGVVPLAVNFTGSATGGTPPYSYSWSFGDGGTSTAQNASHTYTAIGSYAATLTVTDSTSGNATASANISVQTTSAADLTLVAETGAPAPGQGGTTDPSPGNHSFTIGSTVQVQSLPNTDYRFSKWAGDITEASAFSSQTTLTLDRSKSLSATFCTKCGDVNGDLKITPADAQLTFDIYLGRLANPTWCELENADVKSDGTRLTPKVTPADAQMIFNRYLKRGTPTGDCSGSSRTASFSLQNTVFSNATLTINKNSFAAGQDIQIPVIVDSPSEIKAFGFDLAFPSDTLTFVGLESTDLTKDYDQLDANVLSYRVANPTGDDAQNDRVLRVGGYKTGSQQSPNSGVLVTLIFRVAKEATEQGSLSVIATYDDILNASVRNGMANPGNSSRDSQRRNPIQGTEGRLPGKR